ncbi:MAG: hypothetical protein R2726_16265 [Acidimicrobiales bacterium]
MPDADETDLPEDLTPELLDDLRVAFVRAPAPDVEAVHLAAMRAAATSRIVRLRRRLLAPAIAGSAVLFGTAGLAAAGALPAPAQNAVASIVSPFGIELPRKDDPPPPPPTTAAPTTAPGATAPGRGGENPGAADEAPGRQDDPGASDAAPGLGGVNPGIGGGEPPGQVADPGNSANAPGQVGNPGNSGNAPGQVGSPGNSGNAPGQVGSPGNSGNAGSGRQPGQQRQRPGHGGSGNGNAGGNGNGNAGGHGNGNADGHGSSTPSANVRPSGGRRWLGQGGADE